MLCIQIWIPLLFWLWGPHLRRNECPLPGSPLHTQISLFKMYNKHLFNGQSGMDWTKEHQPSASGPRYRLCVSATKWLLLVCFRSSLSLRRNSRAIFAWLTRINPHGNLPRGPTSTEFSYGEEREADTIDFCARLLRKTDVLGYQPKAKARTYNYRASK